MKVRITHPDTIHNVGDEIDIDDAKADRLVNIGYAAYVDRDDPHLATIDLDDDNQPAADNSDTPTKSAVKADWVAHAIAQGANETDAEAMTKQELIDTYG